MKLRGGAGKGQGVGCVDVCWWQCWWGNQVLSWGVEAYWVVNKSLYQPLEEERRGMGSRAPSIPHTASNQTIRGRGCSNWTHGWSRCTRASTASTALQPPYNAPLSWTLTSPLLSVSTSPSRSLFLSDLIAAVHMDGGKNCSVCEPGHTSCGCCVFYYSTSCRNPRVRSRIAPDQYLCVHMCTLLDPGCSLVHVFVLGLIFKSSNRDDKYRCMLWENNPTRRKTL